MTLCTSCKHNDVCIVTNMDAIRGGCTYYTPKTKTTNADRPAPGWISVEERLPEQRINQNTLDFEYVLCATTFGDVRPYKYGRRIGQGEAHFWNGAGYVDAYVTHWMPLPKPPEGGDHDAAD